MNAPTAAGLTVNFSQLSDILAIVLSLVALAVTIVGFFASLKFYRDGVTLQQLANDALIKIDEKASSIQSQVGGMFEKTLDAAIAKKDQLSMNFDAINEQIKNTGREIVDAALKEIGTAGITEREKLKDVVDAQLTVVRKLVEATRLNAQEVVSGIQEAGVIPPRPLKDSILRALRSTGDWTSVPQVAEIAGISIAGAFKGLDLLVRSGHVERTTKETAPFFRVKTEEKEIP